MVRKIILSLTASAIVFANNCENPGNNIDDLLACAKSELLSKNPQANVYIESISIPKNPNDPQYYDFLSAKYNEAFLKIKSQLALKVAGSLLAKEIATKNDERKMPAELVEKILNEQIEAQRKEHVNTNQPGFFERLMTRIFGEDETDRKLREEREKDVVLKAEKELYSNKFKEQMSKVAREEIAGLIPYENFIVVTDKGETVLGIVAYTSSKSRELARALAGGYKATNTTNENQCKKADEVIKEIGSSDAKINKLGLKYFYNEECQPSLLAFGMDTYSIEDGMTNEYKGSSYSMAQALAEKSLANFVKSSVYTYTNAEKVTEIVQTAYSTVIQSKHSDKKSGGKNSTANSYSKLEEFFSSEAQMSLVGVEVANRWTKEFQNHGVAGVIMYYSPTSIESAREEKREINGLNDFSSKKEVKDKAIEPVKGKVIRSKNIDVEDF